VCESHRVKLDIWVFLRNNILNFKGGFFQFPLYSNIGCHSWWLKRHPELQGETFWTLHVLILSLTHSLLNWLSILTCTWHCQPINPIITLEVTSISLDSLEGGHIHHIISTPFINYPNFAIWTWCFKLLTQSLPINLSCATLIYQLTFSHRH